MSVRYQPEDTGIVYQLLAQYSPSFVDDSDSEATTVEASFEAPPQEAERLAAELCKATKGRVDGVWTESTDEDFPFPQFVSGSSSASGGT